MSFFNEDSAWMAGWLDSRVEVEVELVWNSQWQLPKREVEACVAGDFEEVPRGCLESRNSAPALS